MSMLLKRSITPGSRQAPDPFDQFLESHFYYRKHTARDASCLFRVIAEQMYDTQLLHYEVRLECVRFMTRKRRIFEQHVQGDFDSYLQDMAKPKTYGTMLELRAACCMYHRNVVFFEPFNLGSLVTFNKSYPDKFQVFYTNEFHFDSVYKLSDIQDEAICQAISFKLLYKMLFKLPDVNYAVEAMLNPHTFDWGNCQVEMGTRGYMKSIYCRDGRTFHLDMPEDTQCILEDYKQCNFHNTNVQNKDNTPAAAASSSLLSNSHAFDMATNNLITIRKSLELTFVCPNRLNSCVRQLLDDGITPFPYKVAKALDSYIYRNIEFDSWNDMRKEAKRYNVYVNDYNFKTGAKCHVELLIDDDRKMYTCHIQKIYTNKNFCIVHVEKFGKQILVPYVSLHPLPPDEFQPWSVPNRYRRQAHGMHINNKNMPKNMSNMTKFKKTKLYDINYFGASNCEVMQYMQLENYFGSHPLYNEQLSNSAQHGSERVDQAVQREQHAQVFLQQSPAPPPSQSMEAETAAVLTHLQHQQQQPGAAQLAMAGSMGHGQLTTPWLGTPLPLHHLPEAYQAGVYPGLPPPQPSSDGMFMHFGGYAQPMAQQLPPVPLQSPLPLPSFATTPYMVGPTQQSPPLPPLMLPPLNCSNSNSNSCSTSSVSRTIATRYSEAQLESRRAALHSNAEDLQSDLVALHYYKMGHNVHTRMSQIQAAPNPNPNEHLRMYGNGINHNQSNNQIHCNTDQLQVAPQKQRNNESLALVANSSSTPPPSPEAAVAVSSTEPATEKKVRTRPKRGNNCNKMRSEVRPEQLPDLGNDQQQLSHAIMLPTPTPSPNTQGNKFNFYPTPPAASQQQQAQTLPNAPMPPSMFFNPYAWPPGAANMVGMPYEMINNYKMEPTGSGGANAQKTSPPSTHGPPRH
ncbi:protein ovarian tumor locus isoform X2 [Drosophila grimshawi]|uniref:protein ovarian tumor locus isoform X2 n=1 Tax=Drosophila grimshawi TaxID=7222 RepID=UPI000C870EDB|nr:protein ovarian tumor locus isoform X2 [Drosophila grimshawi]